jgi:transcription-repair coupling factor (superfamily II helicase)
MATLSRALSFFGPDIQTLEFPAWDCLPYDRVSPNASVIAQRMTTLSRLARVKGRDKPSVLLTTVNALSQRVPAREFTATHALSVAPGNVLGMAGVVNWLELNGFMRASTVREPGDYAVRGGILDLFPPGLDMPVRFDFFGDALETIKTFDPQTQRSETPLGQLDLVPVAEFQLITETIRKFRTSYVAQFGAASPDDLLYEAVSEAVIPAWSIGCRCFTTSSRPCSTICPARLWHWKRWRMMPCMSVSPRSTTITTRARRR